MNVYFACSITGGREFEAVYQAIVRALQTAGHEVPTASLAGSEVVGLEQVIAPREVFLRDVAWIRQSDALVAEVSTPSHGVGYEVAFALSLGKPVLCCYLEGRAVSKMITGNTSPDLTVSAYQSAGEAASVALAFLNGRTSLTNGGSTLLIEPASR